MVASRLLLPGAAIFLRLARHELQPVAPGLLGSREHEACDGGRGELRFWRQRHKFAACWRGLGGKKLTF